jgi:hypothetical protein
MVIRYVLHPTKTLYNYPTLPNAIADCNTGDIIRIHNGLPTQIISISYFKDISSVVLSFDSSDATEINTLLSSIKSYDDLIIGDNKCVIRAATGNTSIAGTLYTNNDITDNGNLSVNGSTTLNGNVYMTGPTINIGTTGSIVNIQGTTNYVVSNNLEIT